MEQSKLPKKRKDLTTQRVDTEDGRKTINLSIDEYEAVRRMNRDLSFNRGVIESIRQLHLIMDEARESLRGVFAPEEWLYMADVILMTPPMEDYKTNPTEIAQLMTNTRTMASLRAKHGIKASVIGAVVSKLTRAQTIALVTRIEAILASTEGLGNQQAREALADWAEY